MIKTWSQIWSCVSKKTTEAALHGCFSEKVFWKYEANLKENTRTKVWFQKSWTGRNFIEITLWHGCSTVNLLHIFRACFPENSCEGLLLELNGKQYFTCNSLLNWSILVRILLSNKVMMSVCKALKVTSCSRKIFKSVANIFAYRSLDSTDRKKKLLVVGTVFAIL